MKREFLKELGLADDVIEKVMTAHGNAIENSKTKLGEVEKERDNFKEQVDSLSKSVDELKKVDPSKIQEELDKIKMEKTESDQKYADEKKQLLFDNALDLAIASSKTIDPVALKAHIKKENLKYDEKENKLIGFDDQLTSIKESQKYLFDADPDATGDQQGKLPPKEPTLEDAVAQQLFGK